MFNKEPPGCVRGHRNSADKLETQAQTAKRYALSTTALLAERADACFLQELSVEFFDPAVNPRAKDLLESYTVAHAIHAAGKPGTAVLLRKGGALTAVPGAVASAGASEEVTGGTSKSASCVLAEVRGANGAHVRVWLVSVHVTPLKYNPTGAVKLLEGLGDAIRADANATLAGAPLPRIVVGGDFNAEPHELERLQREAPFLGGALARVMPPGHTGLSADFAREETIDHILISPGLRVVGPVETERKPAGGPYAVTTAEESGPAEVVAPSDHIWQRVQLEIA